MDEWEILLFVCIVGMVLLATIALLFGKIGIFGWPSLTCRTTSGEGCAT